MEKTIKKKSTTKKNKTPELKYLRDEFGALIIGWKSIDELAFDVYNSPNKELLQGRLVFALKPSPASKSQLQQIIVVKNPERWEGDEEGKITYSLSYSCGSHTCYIPCALYLYLSNFLVKYLEEWSIDKETIELYKQTIENFKVIE